MKLFEVYNGIIVPAKPGSEVVAVGDSLMLASVSAPYVSGLPTTGDFSGASWVDFNNDGYLDLALARSDSLFLYESREQNFETCPPTDLIAYRFSGIRLAALQSTGAFAWGDYDNDGDLDLVCAVQGVSASGIALYRNNTRVEANDLTAANYVKVDLVGTLSNRAAIGAQVKVTTAVSPGHVLPQFREVEGGCGYSSFNSLTLEFGLGRSMAIDQVEIIWPSGKRDVRTGVAINGHVSFVEPVSVTATVSMSSTLNSGVSATCPGGDGARMTTTLHFVDVPKRPVRASELGLGLPSSSSGVRFYKESGECTTSAIELASADATAANGFMTTFVKTRIAGRGTAQVPITLNGIPITSATLSVVSPDFTPTSMGFVDMSDLTRLAQSLGGQRDNPPPRAPAYLPLVDLNDDGFVDAGDIASFAPHIGQGCSWTPPSSKVTRAVSPGENPTAHSVHSVLAVSPNPVNPTATVKYSVDQPCTVRVYLTDVRGRVVRRLISGFQRAGTYAVVWDGRDNDGRAVSSGIYWCSVDTSTGRETLRVAVVR